MNNPNLPQGMTDEGRGGGPAWLVAVIGSCVAIASVPVYMLFQPLVQEAFRRKQKVGPEPYEAVTRPFFSTASPPKKIPATVEKAEDEQDTGLVELHEERTLPLVYLATSEVFAGKKKGETGGIIAESTGTAPPITYQAEDVHHTNVKPHKDSAARHSGVAKHQNEKAPHTAAKNPQKPPPINYKAALDMEGPPEQSAAQGKAAAGVTKEPGAIGTTGAVGAHHKLNKKRQSHPEDHQRESTEEPAHHDEVGQEGFIEDHPEEHHDDHPHAKKKKRKSSADQ